VAKRTDTKTKGKTRTWRGGGKYVPRRRVCSFCTGKIEEIDYKDASMLGSYISDRGKIEPRRRTGTCARHQRALAVAIKRARHLAMLPFAPEHIYRMGDVATIKYSNIKFEQKPEPETVETAETEAVETTESTDKIEVPE
jgi:small subunit ribosomal protein S18